MHKVPRRDIFLVVVSDVLRISTVYVRIADRTGDDEFVKRAESRS